MESMARVRGAAELREDLASGGIRRAVYGDNHGGQSFTAAESAMLEVAERERRPRTAAGWRDEWENFRCFRIINCRCEDSAAPAQRAGEVFM